jgi:hypothetical protein
MNLNEAITHCEDVVRDSAVHNATDCEKVKCYEEHRQLAMWLRQLRDIKGGNLTSLTDEELCAIAETIDELLEQRKVKEYYFIPRMLGNEQLCWYGATIIRKSVWHDDDCIYEEDDRQYLIPIPDGFSWRADGLIVNDSDRRLTEQDVDEIMSAHGFERAPHDG